MAPHIVLFPFMSKGHTIPLLYLSRLLLHRGATVTIFTTPANLPFISTSLSDTKISIIDLPFPQKINNIPNGIESTDKLPSISLFPFFANETKHMQPHFEKALENLPKVTFIISDGFLYWTLDSANKFKIPRIVFYGMNHYSMALTGSVTQSDDQLISKAKSDDEEFVVPDFPWIKLTRHDFDKVFNEKDGLYFEFLTKMLSATSKSHGLVVNSFYELESIYSDYCNLNTANLPKTWSVGPLCLAEPPKGVPENTKKPSWIEFLDNKLVEGKRVIYVGFGTQADISVEQIKEIKKGFEKSDVNFLWVVRKDIEEVKNGGFEQKVKERGLVVTEWVDQREILAHTSVEGFLSHCGWNSVLESICMKVPILAWPMMAEQPLNARMLVEELKIGLRMKTINGSVKGFVKAEDLEMMVRELMEGEMGKQVRKKVEELGELAIKALQEGGSSCSTLNQLLHDFQQNPNM